MPKGPNGQKRPADMSASALYVTEMAAGEIADENTTNRVEQGRTGAKARADKLTTEERAEIAKKAADARWMQ